MRWAVVIIAGMSIGCFSGRTCEGDVECPLPVDEANACEGRCAPYVGGGWDPVFVSASSGRTRAPCPSAAPFEAMSRTMPPLTACGVLEEEGTCSQAGFVCLPVVEPVWRVCVIRDGDHACPVPYSETVAVPEEPVTLCCPKEPSPPA